MITAHIIQPPPMFPTHVPNIANLLRLPVYEKEGCVVL
jgi:hypothetical protein